MAYGRYCVVVKEDIRQEMVLKERVFCYMKRKTQIFYMHHSLEVKVLSQMLLMVVRVRE